MTTNPVFSVPLSEAATALRSRAETDPTIQAVLAWVDTRNSDYLRTIGLAYHQSEDNDLRRLSQAALAATASSSSPANADEVTVLLNLSSLAQQRDDSEQALRTLERLLAMRPDWRTHPVIVAFRQKLEAGAAQAAVAKQRETELLLAVSGSSAPRGSWLVPGILLAAYALFFALACAWLTGLMVAAVPQVRAMTGIDPQARAAAVAFGVWLSHHQLLVSIGAGLLVIADTLARSGLLLVGAQLLSVDYETPYRLFLREYLVLHVITLVACAVGIYGVTSAFGSRNLSILVGFSVVMAYVGVLSSTVSSRFSLSGWKSLGLVLAMSVAVSVVEYVLLRFTAALLVH